MCVDRGPGGRASGTGEPRHPRRGTELGDKSIGGPCLLAHRESGEFFQYNQKIEMKLLPKTKNGKIMRRAIRARYLGEPAGDLSALDVATPLDEIPTRHAA